MAAHKYYETMKGKDGIGIQYVYHVGKKGKRIVTISIWNFIVEVDAKYIKGMLANPDIVPSASINCWILSILMFHFTLVHIPGTHHEPDGLSRGHLQFGDEPEPKDDFED